MDELSLPLIIGTTVLIILGFGMLAMILNFFKKVEQGQALINNKWGKTEVSFTGMIVLPVVHKAEVMDISVKTIEIDRRGKEGLICQDNIRADIKVMFFVRVNKTQDDVLKVAQAVGCQRASDHATLNELFGAKFSEALKTVGKRLDFEDLYKERDHFKDQIIEVIGHDLNGFVLDDAAIDYLEQTPVEILDSDNILDAQGIRKITELTSAQKVRTNQFENDADKRIKKQDVERQEAILALERQEEDARAKQQREIETVRAREAAEISRVQSEEHLKAELARVKTEEEVAIQEENMRRQIEVAEKNRERVIGIEEERVSKDKQLEAIGRERETELLRIDKEKSLEKQRKEIQDIIRERIAVEKTVAEEEERIKDLRTIAEAKREKAQIVIRAEAEAEEMLVKELKAAEVGEQSAKFKAKERLTLAEAELEAADREAKSKIRMSEGIKAEEAAVGLASAQVREANAVAYEKEGLAKVRVKEADATAIRKLGEAEADVLKQTKSAEASGQEELGLAAVRVREAEAVAIEKQGEAEASVIKEKLFAEAAGLTEKAAAMKALDPESRRHEEFRIKLEADKEIEFARFDVQRELALAQAKVLGSALETANIDIVGGDNLFVDRIVNAVSAGKAIDGLVSKSETASTLLQPYTSGDGELLNGLGDLIAKSGLSTTELKDLSVSAFLAKLMANSDGDSGEKLKALLGESTGKN